MRPISSASLGIFDVSNYGAVGLCDKLCAMRGYPSCHIYVRFLDRYLGLLALKSSVPMACGPSPTYVLVFASAIAFHEYFPFITLLNIHLLLFIPFSYPRNYVSIYHEIQ